MADLLTLLEERRAALAELVRRAVSLVLGWLANEGGGAANEGGWLASWAGGLANGFGGGGGVLGAAG